MSLVLGLGLKNSCPWPREGLSSERLSLALASDFFCVLGLGLEPCVLDSTSALECINLFSTRLKLDNSCAKFIFVSPLFSKILAVRLAAFTAADRVFKRLRQGCNSEGARRGGAPQTKLSPAQTPKRQLEKILVGFSSLL